MSPIALNNSTNGHNDSFVAPASARAANNTKVHPSARRAPEGGLIKVDSENTVYEDGGIKAKYTDRGANVVKDADGRLKVTKTEKTFEFYTKSNVGRVG